MRDVNRLIFGLILAGVLSLAAGSCGGKGGGAMFSTSVPGDKPLGGLSGSELETLCADGKKFGAQPGLRADSCRLAGFFAALFSAGFNAGATDAELRMVCAQAYDGCLNPDPDAGGSGGDSGMCTPAPPSCTATVAEYAACINDSAAQTHALARSIPDCNSLSRASLTESDGGTSSNFGQQPASCVTVSTKCSGVSDEARSFAEQYCGLVQPCCSPVGAGSSCVATVTAAAQSGTYDATAGAACLAALRSRQAGASFCGTLAAVDPGSSRAWAVDPACTRVFQVAGTKRPGEACSDDGECAPGPNGGATCLFNFGAEEPGAPPEVCVQTSRRESDGPCSGTVITGFGVLGGANLSQGILCEQALGVTCDEVTHLCVPVHVAGQACESISECDNVTTFCDFHTCTARLPIDAPCAGALVAECDGAAYCKETTHRCSALGAAGAACSATAAEIGCLSGGFCNNGSCTSPLDSLCR